MKLNIQRETLLKPLQLVIGVVERKQTLPILANVLLKTHHDKLLITGTDLEVELIGAAPLEENCEPNQLTVPGRKLIDICRALPDNAPIALHRDKGKIVLSSGRSRFTLSTLPAEDFPNVTPQDSHLEFSIAQQQLRFLLHRTYFAMAQQDVRYYLNGLLLEVHPAKLRAVATDGHRLATTVTTVKTNASHRLQLIVPRKGIMELLRLLEDSEQPITVTIGNNHIQVNNDEFTFTSKLVEGRFPDYERVIPKNGDKTIVIDRDEFKHALNRTSILCNEKFKGVRLELRRDLMKISTNNPEQEAAEEELNIDYQQEDLDIGFNISYLIDILNTVDSATIRLTFSDANNSVLIEESEHNGDSSFVVMPMRL